MGAEHSSSCTPAWCVPESNVQAKQFSEPPADDEKDGRPRPDPSKYDVIFKDDSDVEDIQSSDDSGGRKFRLRLTRTPESQMTRFELFCHEYYRTHRTAADACVWEFWESKYPTIRAAYANKLRLEHEWATARSRAQRAPQTQIMSHDGDHDDAAGPLTRAGSAGSTGSTGRLKYPPARPRSKAGDFMNLLHDTEDDGLRGRHARAGSAYTRHDRWAAGYMQYSS